MDLSSSSLAQNEKLVSIYNEIYSLELGTLDEEMKRKQILGLITSILKGRVKKANEEKASQQ